MTTLQQRLRYYRKRCAMTQADVAEQLGVSASLVTRIEQGQVSPRIEQIAAFARVYGCSVADLVGDEPSSESARMAAQIDSLDPEVRAGLTVLVSAMVKRMGGD